MELTENVKKQIKQRAMLCAELLDAINPYWRQHVDVKILNMRSSCNCVLGQVFGSYSHAGDILREYIVENLDDDVVFDGEEFGVDEQNDLSEEMDDAFEEEHGYAPHEGDFTTNLWEEMDAVWTDIISNPNN